MTREEKQKAIDALKMSVPIKALTQEEFKGYIQTLNKIIDWLEQEPCDAISRQAAIDIVNNPLNIRLDELIKKLPPVTPAEKEGRWIPVTEKLPEVGSEVLVCYEFKRKRSVYIADFYGDGEFHGLDDEYLTPEGRKYRKAVAWMPLPTPPNKSEIPTGTEGSKK